MAGLGLRAPVLSVYIPSHALGRSRVRGVRVPTGQHRDVFPHLHGGGIDSMSNIQLHKALVWKELNFF